jgi:hypothetical protein
MTTPAPARARANPSRFTVRWVRAVLIGNFALYAFGASVFLLSPRTWLISLALVGPAVLSHRMIASATIALTADGIDVTPVLRRRHLPWARIAEIGVSEATSVAGLTFRAPYFKLDDGSVVVAQNVRSRQTGGTVDEIVAAARRRLGAARQG